MRVARAHCWPASSPCRPASSTKPPSAYLQAATRLQRRDPGRARDPHRAAGQGRQAAGEAIALWRKLGGDALAQSAAEATLALRRGDERQARRQLDALLQRPSEEGWQQAVGVLGIGARDPEQSARLLEQVGRRRQHPAQAAGLAGVRRAGAEARPGRAGRAHRRRGGARDSPASRAWPCCVPASCARPASTDEARKVLARARADAAGGAGAAPGRRRRIRRAGRPAAAAAALARGSAGRPDLCAARLAAGARRGQDRR